MLKRLSGGIPYNSLLFTVCVGCVKIGFVLVSAVLAKATSVDAAILTNSYRSHLLLVSWNKLAEKSAGLPV